MNICMKKQSWKFTMLSVYWMFWSLDSRLVSFTKLKNFFLSLSSFFCQHFWPIYDGNRTEWSLIWSVVIIHVINKIRQPRSKRPICQSRVWLQKELDDKVLSPINHNCYNFQKQKICLGQTSLHFGNSSIFF